MLWGVGEMDRKNRILIQLDNDVHASVFDRVVAVDAGADKVFSYESVAPAQVRDLVHGAIFTRGPQDLHNTAIFIGGKDVTVGEQMLEQVRKAFIGNLRVSVMLDTGGANTTAAAAVLLAGKEFPLRGVPALVLGGTGPVGQRVARLLARQGAKLRVGSRQAEKAANICLKIGHLTGIVPQAVSTGSEDELHGALDGVELVVAAGAAGVTLLPSATRKETKSLKMAIDLNAVPPAGIEGIEVMDKGMMRDGVKCYGAIGVGNTKMKIHRAALAKLFEKNDRVLDAEEIFEIGKGL
jgi:hypothetical protein